MTFFQPLEQFELYNLPIFSLQLYNFLFFYTWLPYFHSITNFFVYLLIICFLFYLFFSYSIKNIFIIPKIWNFIIESLYVFISQLFIQNLTKAAQRFFPFFYFLFLFILITNLVGFLPYSFTITSSIVVTFTLAFSYWLGLTFFSIWKFKLGFFLFFIPGNIPSALKPILAILEVISYISRPFSLSIRLFANMLSGHTLLYILSSISLKLFKFSIFFFLMPFILIVLLNFLEAGIAFLQAYVFYTLIILYFKESYYLAH